MMRRIPAVLATAGLVLGASAVQATADEVPAPLYPATSVAGVLEGLITDATDPRVVEYTLRAGLIQVVPRMLANHPELTDPATYTDPDALARLAQDVVDGSLHTRPTVLGSNLLFVGSPYYMPDWNHDGVFGDPGDYDVDNSPKPAVAKFRYPCIGLDHTVKYRTTSGKCVPEGTPGAQYRTGEVRKLPRIVNSRGLRLATKVWLPHTGLRPGAAKHPGVIFADGNTSRQTDYYAYHQNLAAAGYLVMSFDEGGQGDSEGTILEYQAPEVPGCPGVTGSCRDMQDAVRWFTGADVIPIDTSASPPRLTPRANPAYAPAGDNRHNPVLSLLDRSRVGITGESMGSVATTSYLRYLPGGRDSDGNRLPQVHAAVAISGFVAGIPSNAVPLQAQTSDQDIPGPDPIAEESAYDGPVGSKQWYDKLRATGKGRGAVQLIVMEGGVHIDQSNVALIPRSPWTLGLSTAYQRDHFDCHLKGNRSACARAVGPRPHLSRATASEYDLDGPAGRAPSSCMTVPDSFSVGDPGAIGNLAGRPAYSCVPR
jgi:hypothetical protein